jgi:hypothetical protein
VGWTLQTRERANEGGVSVVMAGGCSSPFIVAGEGHAGVREGETTGGMALTPLIVGWLDEGLGGGGLRGGIKAGSEDFAWHLEVGGRAAWGGRR